jgi:2-iminoacetate synthase ThiH
MSLTMKQITSKSRYKKTSDETYQEIQRLYASIGRVTEMHYVHGIYTREFFDNYITKMTQQIAKLETA